MRHFLIISPDDTVNANNTLSFCNHQAIRIAIIALQVSLEIG